MKTFFLVIGSFVSTVCSGQTVESRLANAVMAMEKDDQFKHAIISLYVIDSKTGKVVLDKNSQLGLAPASCLKVVTSAAALELLGKDYRYRTDIGTDGVIEDGKLKGNLIVTVSGDPTLGSFRWNATHAGNVIETIALKLRELNIKEITGDLIVNETGWETQGTPRGWTWEDMGNYYGAGARGLNWRENQYDIMLIPGKKAGDAVEISKIEPPVELTLMVNELKTGPAGSGDNSIIYLPEEGSVGYLRGTVPAGRETFKISGSIPDPAQNFLIGLTEGLKGFDIRLAGVAKARKAFSFNKETAIPAAKKTVSGISSPSLDSINYWFLQKSVNLYGEAFVKTISYVKTGFGATDTGLNIIKEFWSKNGIEKPALNIKDGSGLSPANRVTTHALVSVMQYAKKQDWYASFYNALPEMNGIKMKSGYIGGVRSYTGYIKSKTGTEYTFAFIINNFDSSPGTVREKMWKLLDILK